MKKLYSLAALALMGGAMCITSCSSDNLAGPETEQPSVTVGPGEQVINIGVDGMSESGATRADGTLPDRKLRSAVARASINRVKVIITRVASIPQSYTGLRDFTPQHWVPAQNGVAGHFADETNGTYIIKAHKEYADWATEANIEDAQTGIKGAQWKLAGAEKLPAGYYVAYAFGTNQNNYSESDTNYGKMVTAPNDSIIANAEWPLKVSKTGTPDAIKEIFAGMTAFEVKGDGSVNGELVLRRQVAGTLGYVTRIPVYGEAPNDHEVGTKLRLVGAGVSTGLVMGALNQTSDVKFVVNGYKHGTDVTSYPALGTGDFDANFPDHMNSHNAKLLWEMNISDWWDTTTNHGDTNGDNTLDIEDQANWKNALSSEKTVSVRKGTMLAGEFVFPFPAVTGTAHALQLQMLNASNKIIRVWNVRLPEADPQLSTKATLYFCNTNGLFNHTAGIDNDQDNYDILRNHLYSIGIRKQFDMDKDKDPDPDDPTPTPGDDDKPADLTKKTIYLNVDPAWETVHQMGLD